MRTTAFTCTNGVYARRRAHDPPRVRPRERGRDDVLTVEGETYADGEDATITATEREAGEIEIGSHELRDGDIVEITVETG